MLCFEWVENSRLCISFAIKNFEDLRVLRVASIELGQMGGATWWKNPTAGPLPARLVACELCRLPTITLSFMVAH